MTWAGGHTAEMRIERVEEPTVFGFTWHIYGLPDDDPRRTYVEFTLEPDGAGTRLTVVETGFAQLPEDAYRRRTTATPRAGRANWASWSTTSMPPDSEAVAEQVFAALADPTRRAILAALASAGPATATDLAAACRSPGRRSPSTWPCWPRPAWCRRAGRAAPGALPAALRPDAGGPAVPGRAGPRLGRPLDALPDHLGR